VTRIYSGKHALLISILVLYSALVAGQQWVGVSSQSPSLPKFISSGNIITSTEVSVEIPGFYQYETVIDGEKYQSPQVPSGHPMLVKGSPDLQKLNFSLQLPASGNAEVLVASSKYVEYTGVNIPPSAGNVPRDGTPCTPVNGDTYNIDAFYPGKLIEAEQPFIVRNSRMQAFQVYPFQYNPVTRVLRFYYQLTFSMAVAGGEGDNPLSANDYYIKQVEGIEACCINSQSNALKAGQLPPDKGCMLIICPEAYLNAIAPLAEWHNQTGTATEIVRAEQFSSALEIYNFVKEYYYTRGNLAYLLLVGDAAQVPTYEYPYGSSDNYYSYLAGNDHYPDILVGRFSAETVKDVEVQVAKTLQYEKDPGIGSNWLASATGIGSTLSPGDDGESDYQHVRNLLNTIKTTTYNQANEFFDGSQGEPDAEGNPSPSDITDKINQGTGVIFYTGHGTPSLMATGSITKSVVEGLNNTGKYPLLWSAACENGNFAKKYCIAESWMRATNGSGQPTGAVAALMSSATQTSFPPMQAQDKIAEIMSNPQDACSTMGAVTVKGLMSMNDVYGSAGYATTDCWILFGDPALRVRTATPGTLIAEHKGTIGFGRTSYSVKCPVNDAFVCISNQGHILGTAAIHDGTAIVYLDQPASNELLTLTITALNYVPYISTIGVIKNPGSPEFFTPVNHSRLQPINSSFTWDSGNEGNPDYYLFYLGTDNPPTNLVNGQKLLTNNFKPEYNFGYNKTYYWKIVAVNMYGTSESKIMDFTTIFSPDEDFEPIFKSRLNWSDGGMQSWQNDASQYFDGKNSIRSGQINNNEYSSLIYPCEVKNCDFVSFWSMTSSEVDDKLSFMIDGVTKGEWSGITGWSFHIYKVEPGLHQLEWRYSKNNEISAGEDAAWLDNIHLPVHQSAITSVTGNGSVCQGSAFETLASASNYFTINWETAGDGTFEDSHLTNATYIPGLQDASHAQTTLKMLVHGYDGCPVTEKSIELEINPLPVITLPSDTIITSGNSVMLDATISGNMNYSWQPGGSSEATILIDSLSSVNGTKNASVTVTSSQGCSATKDILIHFNNSAVSDSYTIFPNPSHGTFSMEPLKGSAIIDQMMLFDREGKLLWKNSEKCSIIGKKQVSLPGVPAGVYFLVTENDFGHTVNPVVIE